MSVVIPKYLKYPLTVDINRLNMGSNGPISKNDTPINSIVFTPKIRNLDIKTNSITDFAKTAMNELGKSLDVTEAGMKDLYVESILSDKSALKIYLPLKPFGIDLSHDWGMGESVRGQWNVSKGKDFVDTALKAAGQTAITKGLEVLGEISGGVPQTALSQIGAYSYSPQRQFYSGVAPISLTFDYEMVPRSEAEANVIKKIIKAFQFLSLPQTSPETAQSALYFGRVPAIWALEFKMFKDDPGIMQNLVYANNIFKFMVCNNVRTSLSEGAFWTSYRDGFPNVIKLSLTFTQFFPIYSAQESMGYDSIDDILEDIPLPVRQKRRTDIEQ